MSEIKLLPCPFCGGEAFIRQNKDAMKTYSAYCGNEDCSASPKISAYGKEMVIDLWNTRKPMQEIVDRLEEYAESNEIVARRLKGIDNKSKNMCRQERANTFRKASKIVKEVGGMNDAY